MLCRRRDSCFSKRRAAGTCYGVGVLWLGDIETVSSGGDDAEGGGAGAGQQKRLNWQKCASKKGAAAGRRAKRSLIS